jgi:hypothetical protein
MSQIETVEADDTAVPDIRITDKVVKRMIEEERRRLGDPNCTKTAGRIIERYFAMISARQPQAA